MEADMLVAERESVVGVRPDASGRLLRLVEYLTRLASLRAKLVRDIADYEKVFWIRDIPKQKGCFTEAWGRDEDHDSDIWVEV